MTASVSCDQLCVWRHQSASVPDAWHQPTHYSIQSLAPACLLIIQHGRLVKEPAHWVLRKCRYLIIRSKYVVYVLVSVSLSWFYMRKQQTCWQ